MFIMLNCNEPVSVECLLCCFRSAKLWRPRLQNRLLYSEILDKHMEVIVTRRTLYMIDEAFGFDFYILKVRNNTWILLLKLIQTNSNKNCEQTLLRVDIIFHRKINCKTYRLIRLMYMDVGTVKLP